MKISEFISEKEIIIGMKATEKQAALDELLQVLEKNNLIQDRKQVLDILLEREKLGSTGIGQGIAVPHAKTDQVKNLDWQIRKAEFLCKAPEEVVAEVISKIQVLIT